MRAPWLGLALLVGCIDNQTWCDPQPFCYCDDSHITFGHQECTEEGDVSCVCDPQDGGGDARVDAYVDAYVVDAGRDASDAYVFASYPDTGVDITLTGSGAVLGLYADADAFYFADSHGIARLRWSDGVNTHNWSASNTLTATAFDGKHLVAFDSARKLTTLDPNSLGELGRADLVEPCYAAVLLSKDRAVCGGVSSSFQRTFTTFDVVQGKLLASSTLDFQGYPMRVVPGLDAFVTTTLSPYDYRLYQLGADHGVKVVGASRDSGPYPASYRPVFTFDDATPRHLIDETGLMLRVGLDCASDQSCFSKDGALGTLSTDVHFAALTSDGKTVVALANTGTIAPFPRSLALQTIDIAERALTSERRVTLGTGVPAAIEANLTQKKVAVVSETGNPQYADYASNNDYQVTLITLP